MDYLGVEAYARSFDQRVREVMPSAAQASRGLRRRLEEAGLQVEDLTGVAALDRLPVLDKDELLERQQADPPFGGFLADGALLRRVFQSPGPLYEPQLDQADPWRWAPALRAAGFGSDDIVVNCFGYHLSPAGAMFEEACRALGACVVPAGVGNLDLQVQACADLGVTAYIGLPSYLKALLEKAEGTGADLSRLGKAFVTAEPLPPSLRAWLSERVSVIRQGYGTAETGNLGYEGAALDGLHVPADALVQVCDLTTGNALYDGSEGQVVATILHPDYPLIRLGTGDLSAWAPDRETDEPTPRIRGWLGRVGDAVKVRGMFLHPRQVSKVMASVNDVASYRFVVDRVDHRDVLRCEVVPTPGTAADQLVRTVASAIRAGLRFDAEVVPVQTLPDEGPISDVRTWD